MFSFLDYNLFGCQLNFGRGGFSVIIWGGRAFDGECVFGCLFDFYIGHFPDIFGGRGELCLAFGIIFYMAINL